MDYRMLLMQYINHVRETEGITFIKSAGEPRFSSEERAELLSLEQNSRDLCAHEMVVEAVDDNGELIEPPYDVCVSCGKEYH